MRRRYAHTQWCARTRARRQSSAGERPSSTDLFLAVLIFQHPNAPSTLPLSPLHDPDACRTLIHFVHCTRTGLLPYDPPSFLLCSLSLRLMSFFIVYPVCPLLSTCFILGPHSAVGGAVQPQCNSSRSTMYLARTGRYPSPRSLATGKLKFCAAAHTGDHCLFRLPRGSCRQ